MRNLQEKLVKFFKSEDGPTAVEYAVMVALIIVVAISAITVLGQKNQWRFYCHILGHSVGRFS